jgi:DNA processing protein
MGWDLHEEACLPSASEPVIELSRDEAGLLSLIVASDPISITRLQELTALDAGTLATLLLNLELAGAIRQVPGKMYLRI